MSSSSSSSIASLALLTTIHNWAYHLISLTPTFSYNMVKYRRSKASWKELPTELKRTIFDKIIEDSRRTNIFSRDIPGLCETVPMLAGYTTVDREWNVHFERAIFRQLVLDSTTDDIEIFRQVVAGKNIVRLEYIRHLRLHIGLPEYDCKSCLKSESKSEVRRHHTLLHSALMPLLETLSTWDSGSYREFSPRSHYIASQPGLQLELSAGSPSDTQHAYRPLALTGHKQIPYETAEDELRGDIDLSLWLLNKQITCEVERSVPNGGHDEVSMRRKLTSDYVRLASERRLYGRHPLTIVPSSLLRLGPGKTKKTQVRRAALQKPIDIVRELKVTRRCTHSFSTDVLYWLLARGKRSIRVLTLEEHTMHGAVNGMIEKMTKSHPNKPTLALQAVRFGSQATLLGAYVDPASVTTRAVNYASISHSLTHAVATGGVNASDFFSKPVALKLAGLKEDLPDPDWETSLPSWKDLEVFVMGDHTDWFQRDTPKDPDSRLLQGTRILNYAAKMAMAMPKLKLVELYTVFPSGHDKTSVDGITFRFEAASSENHCAPRFTITSSFRRSHSRDLCKLFDEACQTLWRAKVPSHQQTYFDIVYHNDAIDKLACYDLTLMETSLLRTLKFHSVWPSIYAKANTRAIKEKKRKAFEIR